MRGLVHLLDALISYLLALFTKPFWLRAAGSFPMLRERLRGNERGIAWSLLVLLILLSVAYLPLLGPAKDVSATRTLIVQVVGGVALLLGFIKGWDEFRHNQAARTEEMRMAREEQVAERFNRAVDQLGHDSMDVRIGGIFALEKIAWDYKDYHWTIMEVLTAYVREHSPWVEPEADGSSPAAASTPGAPRPKADIQIAMTVICRRKLENEGNDGDSPRLDLRRTDLRGLEADNAALQRAYLISSHLEGALLNAAHLENAPLLGVHLKGAMLIGVHLKGVDLSAAHLEGAILFDAHMEGAILMATTLEGAYLSDAHLEGADLSAAHLEDTGGLTWDQLLDARTFKIAVLPMYLVNTPVGYARAVAGGANLKDVPVPEGYIPGKPPEEQPGPQSESSEEGEEQ